MEIEKKTEITYSDDEELVAQFIEWTSGAVTEMRQIVDAFTEPTRRSADPVVRLYDLSHNIKGMGASFNFDLLTLVGTKLCAYMKDMNDTDLVSKAVMAAHVRTFEVVLENRIMGDGGSQGAALDQRLQKIIQENS